MWSGFMVLVASLGSAALTGYIVFRLFRLQGRREDAAAHWQSRRQAYVRLLAATGTVVHTADTLHLIMATRSGWGEGVDVLLHVQRPSSTPSTITTSCVRTRRRSTKRWPRSRRSARSGP